MISYSCRKCFGGKVSVRDCVVEYAKRTGQVIEIDFEGQRMRIDGTTPHTCDEMTFLARHSDKFIRSGQRYRLYDYQWIPIVEHKEEVTLSGREALLKAWKALKEKKTEQLKI